MNEEQVTILQYVETTGPLAGLSPDDSQQLIDNTLHAILHMRPTPPRIYEVVRDGDGNPSLIWVTRTREEWNALTKRVAVWLLTGGAG